MMARETAQAATEALWAAMVELAEAGNDRTVAAQAGASSAEARRIAALATDLAAIARAAEVIASYTLGPSP
jgi:hypothetical protein